MKLRVGVEMSCVMRAVFIFLRLSVGDTMMDHAVLFFKVFVRSQCPVTLPITS